MDRDEGIPNFDARMSAAIAEHRIHRNDFPKNGDKQALATTFHRNIGSARSWNMYRWMNGVRSVFVPEAEVVVYADDGSVYEEEEDGDDE